MISGKKSETSYKSNVMLQFQIPSILLTLSTIKVKYGSTGNYHLTKEYNSVTPNDFWQKTEKSYILLQLQVPSILLTSSTIKVKYGSMGNYHLTKEYNSVTPNDFWQKNREKYWLVVKPGMSASMF